VSGIQRILAVEKRITFVPIKYALTTASTISDRIIFRHFRHHHFRAAGRTTGPVCNP
jgi:hypothetical protein